MVAQAHAKDCRANEKQRNDLVVIIDCNEHIPCNPCETACPRGAINVGERITNLPKVNSERCIGCYRCIATCPGQAIHIVSYGWSDNAALVSLPYELLPRPDLGDTVEVYDALGEHIGQGQVQDIRQPETFNKTAVISVAVPKTIASLVRFFRYSRDGEEYR